MVSSLSTRPAFRAAFIVAAAIGGLAVPGSARASIAGFGDLSGFQVNKGDSSTSPTYNGGVLQLTSPGGGQVRSIFNTTVQPISVFTASFTYRAASSPSNPVGAAFVLQNAAAGPGALGANFNATGFGYDGIGSSVGLTLEVGGGPESASGLYLNGNVNGGGALTAPLDMGTNHPIAVKLVYNGALLSETLTDMVTLQTFTNAFIVNIPATVGGSTAYVGLTANGGNPNFNVGMSQYFSDFSFVNAVPEPSSLGLGGIGGLVMLRRRR